MKTTRFTNAQIIGFLKWRSKFGGMEASDVSRLRDLESENNKLKRLLAEAQLDIRARKSVFGVKR
jgi:putative transposase